MKTKYPIVLVHGIAAKELKFFKAFGLIERNLKKAGFDVSTAPTDGFGSIESNGEQLSTHIKKLLFETGAEKVNLIGHSKGGLDSRYVASSAEMEGKIASITCLCSPHQGSRIASRLYSLPKIIKYPIACFLHTFYKLLGDKNPDVLTVCRQLSYVPEGVPELSNSKIPEGVFAQSYSATMDKSRDDFIMTIPHLFSKIIEKEPETDGLVTKESAKFGEFRGDCSEGSVSHAEMAGFSLHKKKRAEVYAFYIQLCRDLAERGY